MHPGNELVGERLRARRIVLLLGIVALGSARAAHDVDDAMRLRTRAVAERLVEFPVARHLPLRAGGRTIRLCRRYERQRETALVVVNLRVPISEGFRLMPPSWFLRFGTGQAGLG